VVAPPEGKAPHREAGKAAVPLRPIQSRDTADLKGQRLGEIQ